MQLIRLVKRSTWTKHRQNAFDYVVAMAKNAVLQRHAESAMQVARAQSEVRGETAHVYTDTRYAAGTWDHERRVVIKAEVVRLDRTSCCLFSANQLRVFLTAAAYVLMQELRWVRLFFVDGPRGCRTRAGRARRIAHPLRRAHLLPGRHGPLRPTGLSLPNPRVRHAPPVGCLNPGSACRRRCPRPIPAPSTPFGGRIWTFMNNAG